MPPWDELAARVAATVPAGVNVRTGPVPQVEPDSIVIAPGEPWLEAIGGSFRSRPERYSATAATRVADPASALGSLYGMILGILEAASDAGWTWESVSGLTPDESTGVPLLVATVSVKYSAPLGG